MFRTPLSHLPDNPFFKYALQLSMYGYFLELHGYKVKSLIIDYVHSKYVTPEQFDPKVDFELVSELDLNRIRIVDRNKGVNGIEEKEVPYLRRDVINILKIREFQISN